MPITLGLDSGSAGVRRIAIEQRWGRLDVVAVPANPAQTVLSAPAADLTFRALSLPFTDRRRLSPMVAQELEHSLGFPPGDAAWDFVARPPSDSGENVYVVACALSTIQALLDAAPTPRPTVVDAEPYALQRALAHAGVSDALIADLGARHTTFCRIRGGHLDYVRVLLRGGNDIDAAVARARADLSPEQAKALKHDRGLELPEVEAFLERLVSDALLPPEAADVPMYLTGGSARLRGLDAFLRKRLDRPVQRIPVPEGVDADTDVIAFGMALWGMRNGEGVNLHAARETRSLAPAIAIITALALLLVSADVMVRRVTLGRELARNQDAVKSIARTAAGVGSLAELESVLLARTGGGGGTGRNLEAVMITLSEALSEASGKEKAGDLKVEEVVVGANEVRVRGSAASYPAVEALKNALAARFGDVNVSSTQLPPEPGQTTAHQGFTMVAPLSDTASGTVAQ